jgi:hypothetical protein
MVSHQQQRGPVARVQVSASPYWCVGWWHVECAAALLSDP